MQSIFGGYVFLDFLKLKAQVLIKKIIFSATIMWFFTSFRALLWVLHFLISNVDSSEFVIKNTYENFGTIFAINTTFFDNIPENK